MRRLLAVSRRMHRQRGVAGMMAMLFLLVVVGFSAVTLLNMSSSDLQDTTAQNDGVAALFLAETGIERASQLYSTGTPCATLVPTSPPPLPPPVLFGRGSVTYTGVAPVLVAGVPVSCRIQSRGIVGNTTRTIEVDLQRGPAAGDISYLNSVSSTTTNSSLLQWNHTIAATAGSNRIVVVGVSIRGAAIVTSGTYNGVAMTRAGFGGLPPPVVNGTVRVEWLYALNPPTGTSQIRVILSPPAGRAVAGALAFSGVDQVTPIDAVAIGTGNYPSQPSVNITPVTDKTWIVDALAVQLNVSSASAGAGQTNPAAWRTSSGGGPPAGVFGAGSYKGPVSPIATVPMSWTLALNPPPMPPTHAWAHSVLALRPILSLHIARWTEL